MLKAKMLSTFALALACSLFSSLVRAQDSDFITFWPSQGCTTYAAGPTATITSSVIPAPIGTPAQVPLFAFGPLADGYVSIEWGSLEIPSNLVCFVTCVEISIVAASTIACTDPEGNSVIGTSAFGDDYAPYLADAASLLTPNFDAKAGCYDNCRQLVDDTVPAAQGYGVNVTETASANLVFAIDLATWYLPNGAGGWIQCQGAVTSW